MSNIKVTEKEYTAIIQKINAIKEVNKAWCNICNVQDRTVNILKDKTEAEIIIEALDAYFYDEFGDLECAYSAIERKMKDDKAN